MPCRHPITDLIAILDMQVRAGTKLYVTVLPTRGDLMTFAGDNWEHIVSMADGLVSSGTVDFEDVPQCAIIVRRFDGPPASGERIPPKSVAGFLVSGTRILALSAEQQRDANETDYETGLPLPPEPLVTYLHGLDMVPELKGMAWKRGHPPPPRQQAGRRVTGRRR